MGNLIVFIKKNWIYLLVFIIVLVTMIYTAFSNNIIKSMSRYLSNEDFRVNYCVGNDVANCHVENLFDLVKHLYKNGVWEFDVQIIFGTRIFAVLIPFFCIIEGVKFYWQSHSILKFKYHRITNYRMFIIKNMTLNAFKNAIVIFAAYLAFYGLMFVFTKGELNTSVVQNFLAEILGEDFYLNHPYLYYLYDGLIRFFLMPFIYTFFAQSIALVAKSVKKVFVAPVAYFFGLSAIGASLYLINSDLGVYFSPLAIMNADAYNNTNSYLLFLANSIPLLISIMIIIRKTKYVEI